jgi:uncharacterized protein (TIRG00374 family)
VSTPTDGFEECVDEADVLAASSRRTRFAVLAAGGASLVVFAPVIDDVYSSLGTAVHANPVWVLVALGCMAAGFACCWALQRLTLRVHGWYDVAGPQLAGNAASNLLPLGSAFGPVIQLRMLTRNRIDLTRAVTGLAVAGMLSALAGTILSPLLMILPVGDATNSDIDTVAHGGLIALLIWLPLVLIAVHTDRPIQWLGRTVHTTLRRIPRCRPPDDLPERIVAERDAIRDAISHRKVLVAVTAAGKTLGDYLALYASMLAVGLHPSPTIVLVALAAANAAGMIPVTPGGLGFVEAGLTGTLVLTGAHEQQALAAVAVYRLVTCWLPVVAGTAAYVMSRRTAPSPRHGATSIRVADELPVAPAIAS